MLVSLAAQRAVVCADRRRCTWMYETVRPRGGPEQLWLRQAWVVAAVNCLCLPGLAEPDEWVRRGSGQFHALAGGLAADGVGRAFGVTDLRGR